MAQQKKSEQRSDSFFRAIARGANRLADATWTRWAMLALIIVLIIGIGYCAFK